MKPTSFVVFGQARTGSSLLVDLLNHHPQIRCADEIMNGIRLRNRPWKRLLHQHAPRLLIELHRLKSQAGSRKRIYGFKLLSKQLRQPAPLLRSMQRGGWIIIHLYRRDLFRQVISMAVARTTHRYNSLRHQAAAAEPPQLTIPPERFIRMARISLRQLHKNRLLMAGLPHLQVVYEDDLKTPTDQQRTVRRIVDLLGVEAIDDEFVTSVQPPWKTPYSEIVVNYDELQALYRTLIRELPAGQTEGLLRD